MNCSLNVFGEQFFLFTNSSTMNKKIIIYQVLPRLYGNKVANPVPYGSIERNGCGKFVDFTSARLKKIRDLGVTHVWFTGILEHATTTDYTAYGIKKDCESIVKGNAGSPYAVKDYYDVDPDLAVNVPQRMEEFEALLARTHRAGMKVVIDFVPNHVARTYNSDAAPKGVEDFGASDDKTQSFNPDNNFYYIPNEPFRCPVQGREEYEEFPARATGNDKFSASPDACDWYETVKLNYGVDYQNGGKTYFNPVPDTWKKMFDILDYWSAKGVDAFRCDMAEMVPVEFWQWVIGKIKAKYPSVLFIAEIYNPYRYNDYVNIGGFDYLYDKVGLYNTIREVVCGRRPASDITYCWQSAGNLQSNMLGFIENHDEQRVASEFYAGNPLKGRAPMITTALMNVNPVMIYAGQEYGEPGMDCEGFSSRDGRTTIYDYWSPALMRKVLFEPESLTPVEVSLHDFYGKLLNIAKKEKAVSEGLFFDLTYCNFDRYEEYPSDKVYSFLRKSKKSLLLVVSNFAERDFRLQVNIPGHAFEYMSITPGEHECRDLLGECKAFRRILSPDKTIQVDVPALSGVVLELTKTN